jgi:hypothetical protein
MIVNVWAGEAVNRIPRATFRDRAMDERRWNRLWTSSGFL